MNLQLLSTVDAFYSETLAPFSAEAVEKAVTFGLPFSLFGFGTVFAVLVLLCFVVTIFGKVFGSKSNAPKKTAPVKVEKKAEAAPVVNETQAAPAVSDEGGIVAAIMAAISAFRASNGESAGGFRVVSFKKRK